MPPDGMTALPFDSDVAIDVSDPFAGVAGSGFRFDENSGIE
jgi:hypothetical protein